LAPKIERDMALVPWEEGNGVVARHIRAYDPKPGAFTLRNGQELKLFGALATEQGGDEGSTMAGQVLEIDGTGMLVACGDGAVRVLQVQAPGKRRNSALEFARGRGVAVGDVLGGKP
jgi:methionyl-tRNA formyltransferase